MAEEDDIVLRLLREIRTDQLDQGRRLIKVERRLDEMHEGMTTALGMAAHSNLVAEQFGQRFDEVEDQLNALRRRVSELESRK
ncbi:hypothetical protein [Amaricoccus solimangrovi]|uniref:Uncharacterized protein n=1 Tax=Amaricoccus solimangrovi TaxID=2589815 RepID=A0A501X1E2_9RHOB|nr:hypothetical protein [Amaricoccus solimangrovi]TPE53876.1 hypothetical protein FJM51_02180 [Amaricoccus solimangrovi]